MKILIGSAWPYANGSLHIGHLAGLLPADIIARYHRAKKDDVYFVSGSDCYGTPVAVRARQENRTPQEICDGYHEEFCTCFQKLGLNKIAARWPTKVMEQFLFANNKKTVATKS